MATSREIILANLNHDNPQRPGMTFSGGRMNDIVSAGIGTPRNWQQKRWIEGDTEYYDDIWGNVWRRLVNGAFRGEIYKPAIADWSQLDTLRVPDYEDSTLYEQAKAVFSQPTDKFKLASVGGWVFNDCRYMRSMETYLMDLVENRQSIDRLHRIVSQVYETKIRKMGECGADGIFFIEDWGTQTGPLVGPPMWRDIYKTMYKRLTDVAHEYGMRVFTHSCGQNFLLLDDLAEAGIDCFQFDQPAAYDMIALGEKLREHKVALWSPIDIQKVLPTGDKALIEAEAKKMIDLFQGCLILKNYPELKAIGVEPEWDQWAYDAIIRGLTP